MGAAYAERGFHVFPCHSVNADGSCTCDDPACEDIGKHPRTTKGFKNSSNDKAQIEKSFGAKAKLSNVAIRTGKVSGITIIDINMGPGKMGGQTWSELTREHGEPQTLPRHDREWRGARLLPIQLRVENVRQHPGQARGLPQ